jgi:hypothetical protein
MFNGINNFFATPEYRDESFIRLTRNILLFTLLATFLLIIVVVSSSDMSGSIAPIAVLIVLSALEIMALLMVLRGSVALANIIIPIALTIAVTINAWNGNSIHDI